MRLDKYLANMGKGSRAEVKKKIAAGLVSVNGVVAKSAKRQVDESRDVVMLVDQTIDYQPFVYLMLNKDKGYISSTEKGETPTVLDCVPLQFRHYDLFPVGRLDKDTTGLLLITNDGKLAHRLLAPRHHVAKTYRVDCALPLTEAQLDQLRKGVLIADNYRTKPAEVQQTKDCQIDLTIYEGKYHQVKQMLMAVANRVVALERIAFAGIALDNTLKRGQVRELYDDELAHLLNL